MCGEISANPVAATGNGKMSANTQEDRDRQAIVSTQKDRIVSSVSSVRILGLLAVEILVARLPFSFCKANVLLAFY